MRERRLPLILIALVSAVLVATPAHAAHVQCGDTITQDTTLDSDLTGCTQGLTIGADGVTLDLGGHTIDAAAEGGRGVAAHSRRETTITNGTIRGFRSGVFGESPDGVLLSRLTLLGNDTGANLFFSEGLSEIRDVKAIGGQVGLNLDGRIHVARSHAAGNDFAGIALDFTTGTIEDSTIRANRFGIHLEEADADIRRNRIVENQDAGLLYGYWQEGSLTGNLIANNGLGVRIGSSAIQVLGNTVRANRGNGIEGGRELDGSDAVIAQNQVIRNGGTGIVTGCTPIRRNIVHRNGADGISSNCGFTDDPSSHVQPIEDNDVRRNARDGIAVRQNNALVHVTGNRTYGNGDDGIDVGARAFAIAGATWSPDGEQIAARTHLSDPAMEAIYLFAADGSTVRRLVAGAQPSWSPSGDRIAYGNSGIHTIGVDGSDPTQLTSEPADSSPQWSPTGDMILLQRGGFINVIPANGGSAVQVARGTDPEWSPDGTRIVYQAANEIHVVQADGSQDVLVVEGGYPTWSPDGNRIAFTDGTDLATIAVDGTDLHYLTADDPADYAPDWSPDGSEIAFLRTSGADVGVWVVAADGGPISRVGDGNTPPEWPLDRGRIQSDGTIVGYDGTLLATLDIDSNPFVTIARNRADRNADLGIEAVEQVVDGGGNRAEHNGDPRQCLGVACR